MGRGAKSDGMTTCAFKSMAGESSSGRAGRRIQAERNTVRMEMTVGLKDTIYNSCDHQPVERTGLNTKSKSKKVETGDQAIDGVEPTASVSALGLDPDTKEDCYH